MKTTENSTKCGAKNGSKNGAMCGAKCTTENVTVCVAKCVTVQGERNEGLDIAKSVVLGEVLVRHGEIKVIARLMRVSERSVHSALRGVTKSELSRRIRCMAVLRGGVERPR